MQLRAPESENTSLFLPFPKSLWFSLKKQTTQPGTMAHHPSELHFPKTLSRQQELLQLFTLQRKTLPGKGTAVFLTGTENNLKLKTITH